MVSFLRRRTSAMAEGALVAIIVAMLAGPAGLTAFAMAGRGGPSATIESLEGVLTVRHGDDFATGRVVGHAYSLTNADGETQLGFLGAPPDDALAGSRIRVHGAGRAGGRFYVADGGTTQLAKAATTTASTGAKSVAVVLLNFSNDTSEPYTPSFAAGVAFTDTKSVRAYYAETSWGQLTVTGDVFGWYTLPDTNDACATSSWAQAATTAATAAGADLDAYDNVVYAFPYVPSCPWSGLASMPGRVSWLNGPAAMSLRTMAHELGHNFGTHHASSLTCTESGIRVALSATCASTEYGDPFTVMGSASHYQQTNFSRGNFGWLSRSQTQTVTASGDYMLSPIELDDPSLVQVLRIPRGDSGTYLTLEFRQAFGTLFDTFSSLDPVTNGVTVRLTAGQTAMTQTRLIDTTSATSSFTDAPLVPGRTLTDPVSGVSITTLTVSASGASVHISFDSPATPTPAPTASSAPTQTPAPTPSPGATATPAPTPAPTATPAPTPAPTARPTPTPVADTEPPTTPAALKAAPGKGKKVALTWSASSDNIAVTGYAVFRDGTRIGTTSKTGFTDAVPGRAATHSWFVVAYDRADNMSPPSESISVSP